VEIFAALAVDLSSKSFIKKRSKRTSSCGRNELAAVQFPLTADGVNFFQGELDEVSSL
jgi:hypothetical protein